MNSRLTIIMGVSGTGKTTIAKALSEVVDGVFLDGDNYHTKSNIRKMAKGDNLSDDDRWPWLSLFGQTMAATQSHAVIGACSALKKSYRERLICAAEEPIQFVYLHGRKEVIRERLLKRKNHFFSATQLENQLNTLEVPKMNESALHININHPVDELVRKIHFNLTHPAG